MITFELKGQKELIARLGGMPKSILAEVKEAIKEQTLHILKRAKQKVSGEVLKNRTGTLRRKINQRVEVTNNSVVGRVGIMLSYAAAHEFGSNASGVCLVHEHLRRVKNSTKLANVSAHMRAWKMNLPERSFLRSALRELEPQIKAAIEAAVQRGINK